MTLLLVLAAMTIGMSFLCSLLEAALLSLSPSYVKMLVTERPRLGNLLDKMKDNIDRPLAAILTFNTIANTAGAVGVGAQAEKIFGDKAIGIVSAGLTLVILIVSEIVPKTLGAVYAKPLAGFTAYATWTMIIISQPLLIGVHALSRLLGPGRRQDLMSRAELITAIRLGQRSGALEQGEFGIISNVIALRQVSLSTVMTPRTVLFSLPETATVEQVLAEHQPIRFARFPIYGHSTDDVKGYVARFDVHEALAAGAKHKTLGELARPMPFLPRQASVASAMNLMLKAQQHIAVVVDERGGTDGIVTLEDTIETLLGREIVDETDTVTDMQQLARQRKTRKA